MRVSVSKETLEQAPKAKGGEVDEQAVAEHYGLAAAVEGPPTQGYGEVNPDDPAFAADQEAIRAGLEPAEQERARIRESIRPEGRDPAEGSPGRPIIR